MKKIYSQIQQNFFLQELTEEWTAQLFHQTMPEEAVLLTLLPAQPFSCIHQDAPALIAEAFGLVAHHSHQLHPKFPAVNYGLVQWPISTVHRNSGEQKRQQSKLKNTSYLQFLQQ